MLPRDRRPSPARCSRCREHARPRALRSARRTRPSRCARSCVAAGSSTCARCSWRMTMRTPRRSTTAQSPSCTRRLCARAALTSTRCRVPRGPARATSPPCSRPSTGLVAEHRVEHVMGMPVSIEVLDDVGPGAVDEVLTWLQHVDATFSTYRDDSQVARLDRGELDLDDADADVREVLAACEAYRLASGGFFDMRASGGLDPSGLVKGWALDRAAAILERAGARCFCLNAGGDVLVRGSSPWRIGIQHPRLRDRLAGVVALSDGAVATSGGYER